MNSKLLAALNEVRKILGIDKHSPKKLKAEMLKWLIF